MIKYLAFSNLIILVLLSLRIIGGWWLLNYNNTLVNFEQVFGNWILENLNKYVIRRLFVF